MAASTKEKNTTNKLFTTADNSPLIFFMRPCAERQILKPLINEHGGQITSILSPTCVKLAEKGSIVSSSDYLSSMYVKQCIQQNKLLEMDEFSIKPGTVAPRNPTSDDESTVSDISLSPADYIRKYKPSDLKGRMKYTKEDDIAIIRFLITENLYHKTKGLTLWKEMERLKVVNHSAQSMHTRYRKVILPNIMSYSEDIHRSWISKLTGDVIPKPNSSYSVEDLFKKGDPEEKVTKLSEPETSTATSIIDKDSRAAKKYQQLEFVSCSDKNENAEAETVREDTSKYFSNKKTKTGDNVSISSIKKFSPLKKSGASTSKSGDICRKSKTERDHGNDGNKDLVNTVVPLIARDINIKIKSRKDRDTENISVKMADTLKPKRNNTNTKSGKDRKSENASLKIADALKAKYSYSKTRTVTRASKDTDFSSESAKVLSTVKDNEKPIQHSERKANSPNIKNKMPDKSNANLVSDRRKRKRRHQNISQRSSDTEERPNEAVKYDSLDSESDIFELPDSDVLIIDSQDCMENVEADSLCVKVSQEQLDKADTNDMINDTPETSDESCQLLLGPKTSTPYSYLAKRRPDTAEEHIQRTEDCKAFCQETSLKYDLKYESVHSLLFRCNGQVTRVLGYIEYGPYSFQLPPWTINDDKLLDDHQNIPHLILKYGQRDVNERLHFLEEL